MPPNEAQETSDAKVFFDQARKAVEVLDYETAIQAYLAGLYLAPESVDAHIDLRMAGLRRREAGGPPPTDAEIAGHKQGKTPLDMMLGAEFLLAKYPEHLPYAELLLKAAVAGGYRKTATWIADLVFLANNRAEKPAMSVYLLLKEAYATIGAHERAISACQRALKLQPRDRALAEQLREMATKYGQTTGQRDGPNHGSMEPAMDDELSQIPSIPDPISAPIQVAPSKPADDPNLDAGRLFFEKAAEAAEMGNYDYAIELYLDGLRRAPEALDDGHLPLFKVALQRQSNGGKKPSMMERAMGLRSKAPLEQMLTAEALFAKDPSHLHYGEAMLKAAVEGGFHKTAHWIANLIFQTNNAVERPSLSTYILLKDSYAAIQQWDKALAALQRAMRIKPEDHSLAEEYKNLSAELTMARGRYDQEGDFRQSIKDQDKQSQLYAQDRVVKSDNFRQIAVQEARKEFAANPALPKAVFSLAAALADLETDAADEEAVALLEKAFAESRSFAFKEKAGQLRLKNLRRKHLASRRAFEADPTHPQLKTESERLAMEIHAMELEHYRLCSDAFPTDQKYRYEYALRLAQAGRHDEAIPLFQESQKDPARRTSAMNQIGLCFFAKGWLTDAADVFTRALDEQEIKDNALGKELRYNLASTYQRQGQTDAALEIYRKIAQLDYGFKDVSQRVNSLRAKGKGEGGEPDGKTEGR